MQKLIDAADYIPLGAPQDQAAEPVTFQWPPEKTRHSSFAAMGRFQPAAGKPAVADNPALRARDPGTRTLPGQQEIRQTPVIPKLMKVNITRVDQDDAADFSPIGDGDAGDGEDGPGQQAPMLRLAADKAKKHQADASKKQTKIQYDFLGPRY